MRLGGLELSIIESTKSWYLIRWISVRITERFLVLVALFVMRDAAHHVQNTGIQSPIEMVGA